MREHIFRIPSGAIEETRSFLTGRTRPVMTGCGNYPKDCGASKLEISCSRDRPGSYRCFSAGRDRVVWCGANSVSSPDADS